MNYEESLAWLSGLQGRGWRLGLDRMRAFVRAAGLDDVLGGPSSPIQYLHVAGTNGKGSVTAYLQAMLVAQGYKTGGYFSPYVVDPRERIQIGGELISETEFAAVATELREVAERFDQTEEGGVTEFEVKTAMGFLAWKRAGVEVVALEVGLGGRLDATNVVTSTACAIVSISLDHTSILGHTEAEIAREKAGILKPGVPAVVGKMGDQARREIEVIATRVGAPLLRLYDSDVDREVRIVADEDGNAVDVRTSHSEIRLTPGLAGRHQFGNVAVAYATLEAGGYLRDSEVVRSAAAATRLVGRLQWIRVNGRPL
ncbi:bifunctional folylpolyglutamate synthase/dihydrofolate synthase, partial [bacterium]